jgi:hypothetical protein
MVSDIARSYPYITRDKFENGEGNNKISYREWGSAKSDTEGINYQNLIVKEDNFTWYIILLYKNGYRNEVDRIIRSLNFTI